MSRQAGLALESQLKMGQSPPLLECRNVTIYRGLRPALEEVSLKIELGEHVAILGPNGSGKSTLIKAILRECYPVVRPGSWMRILGREQWNIFGLRPLFGVVTDEWPQACLLGSVVRDVVLSGYFSSPGIWRHHRVTEQMRSAAAAVMDLLEIGHLADRLLEELSTGEARRVLIARALVHQPRTLLLDEPTANLDVRAAWLLRELLRGVARRGTGLVVVTHQADDVLPEIERVILLRQGRVFRDGAKEEVLREGVLSELFGHSVRLERRDGYYHLW